MAIRDSMMIIAQPITKIIVRKPPFGLPIPLMCTYATAIRLIRNSEASKFTKNALAPAKMHETTAIAKKGAVSVKLE